VLNEDYRDMLRALTDEKASFILVGAYALAARGYPRATMDIDIPSIDDLILNKRATGRTKDLADAETLESLKNSEQDP
jgi:hypothetical protein